MYVCVWRAWGKPTQSIVFEILTQNLTTFKMEFQTKVVRNESFDSLGGVEFLVDELESSRLGADSPKPKVTEMRQRELRGEIVEPLLVEDKTRFVLFPIKHHDVSTIICHFCYLYFVSQTKQFNSNY